MIPDQFRLTIREALKRIADLINAGIAYETSIIQAIDDEASVARAPARRAHLDAALRGVGPQAVGGDD